MLPSEPLNQLPSDPALEPFGWVGKKRQEFGDKLQKVRKTQQGNPKPQRKNRKNPKARKSKRENIQIE